MDINFTITQGIGTPGDIKHFILFGLSPLPATGNLLRNSSLNGIGGFFNPGLAGL